MASKRKVNLDDYQLTTTLGTGKKNTLIYVYFDDWKDYLLC